MRETIRGRCEPGSSKLSISMRSDGRSITPSDTQPNTATTDQSNSSTPEVYHGHSTYTGCQPSSRSHSSLSICRRIRRTPKEHQKNRLSALSFDSMSTSTNVPNWGILEARRHRSPVTRSQTTGSRRIAAASRRSLFAPPFRQLQHELGCEGTADENCCGLDGCLMVRIPDPFQPQGDGA